MRVPFMNLRLQHEHLLSHLYKEFDEIFANSSFILSKTVREFEAAFAAYINTPHAIGVASGTDALLLSLAALGLGPDDEVIVPAFTFVATADVVVRCGARPVFVDIEPRRYTLDPEKLSNAITPQTKAIVYVYLFGHRPANEEVLRIAQEQNIPVIEDVAQAAGARMGGKFLGTFGLTGCFSFYPTKNLGGAGDGGLIATADDRLADLFRKYRDHGRISGYYHDHIGFNSRLDALQAALLKLKLPALEQMNAERIRLAHLYNLLLEGLDVILPSISDDYGDVFSLYVIQTERRDALLEYLLSKKVGVGVYYPVPLHLQPCMGFLGYQQGDFPVSEQICQKVLALPLYPGLTDAY
jgi:dTDP-4-amino-4,6-dideoxygalactose transaminase